MIRQTILAATLALSLSSHAVAQEPTKLTVLLDWFVNPDHAPARRREGEGLVR